MPTRFQVVAGSSAVIATLLGVLALYSPELQAKLSSSNSADLVDRAHWNDPDTLYIAFCGTGTEFYTPDRAGACVAVVAGDEVFVVDAGPGASQRLAHWQLAGPQLAGVFLTHYHSDHIGDVADIQTRSWRAGRNAPLDIYGPPGVHDVVDGLNQAFSFDRRSRELDPSKGWTRGANRLLAVEVPQHSDPTTVLKRGELHVRAISVNHWPVESAVAYRFDYRGRSVVISGDTEQHPPLARLAAGADVLIHEAVAPTEVDLSVRALETRDPMEAAALSRAKDLHTTTEESSGIGEIADVRMLVLTHPIPAPTSALERRRFLEGVNQRAFEAVHLAEDGMVIQLKAPGTSWELSELPIR